MSARIETPENLPSPSEMPSKRVAIRAGNRGDNSPTRPWGEGPNVRLVAPTERYLRAAADGMAPSWGDIW